MPSRKGTTQALAPNKAPSLMPTISKPDNWTLSNPQNGFIVIEYNGLDPKYLMDKIERVLFQERFLIEDRQKYDRALQTDEGLQEWLRSTYWPQYKNFMPVVRAGTY